MSNSTYLHPVSSVGECKALIVKWIAKLTLEIEKATGKPLVVIPTNYEWSGREYPPIFIASLGHCVVYVAVKPVGYSSYLPVLVISEKKGRKYRPGCGQSRVYNPRANGEPNFKAAINNAMVRNREIDLMSSEVSDEDLGWHLPKGVIVKRQSDGTYILNAFNQKLSFGHVEEIIRIIERGSKYVHGVESKHSGHETQEKGKRS